MATARKKSERPGVSGNRGKKVVKSCTINKGAAELFQFWRRLQNLPRFTRHLISVEETGENRSHWIAKSPMGTVSEWDALIVNEHLNELIAWESEPGSEIENAGSVRFREAPGAQGTEVTVSLEYVPPAGKIGSAIAKLYGEEPELTVEDDLLRFKALMETGEIPTTEGEPAGSSRGHGAHRRNT